MRWVAAHCAPRSGAARNFCFIFVIPVGILATQSAVLQGFLRREARVLRGGSWNNNPNNARSSARNNNHPDNRNNNIGFRVLCESHIKIRFAAGIVSRLRLADRGQSGGVAKNSMHTHGKAIDIRLPSRRLSDLRTVAMSLQAGGVGYYPSSNFIHLDTGDFRF